LSLLHQAEYQVLDNEQIAIEWVIETISEQVHISHHTKHIALQIAIVDGLQIHGDRAAWEVILRNLIDNAYKYTPDDGVVTITADESHLAIHNTWSSLSDEQIDRIREPLRQADSSKNIDQWYGLGLTLVRTLIEKMGYRIQVVSDESGVRCEIDLT
jgi:signal transduction histidine kinase